MRYYEFRDVMICKGYTIVDVLDCVRDFYRSDACSNFFMNALNEFVSLFCDHILDPFVRAKKHYDLDDAFDKLMDKYNSENNWFRDRSVDDVFDDLCFDVWKHCDLDHFLLDDYWQDVLRDC